MSSNSAVNTSALDCQARILSFMEGLETHPVYDNPYFKFLNAVTWNTDIYALHRANFFCRTELTVKGIAHLCARAAEESDRFTLNLFAYILNEEAGSGNVKHNHEEFMENAHNIYGEVEFGLRPLLVKDAKDSDLIISETLAYRSRLKELISGSYPCMLGVAMALESHADIMLQNFRSAFRSNRRKLNEPEFVNKVEIYFNSHVGNGVEERHAADARRCVLNNCRDESDFEQITYGAEETLKAQLTMWNALFRRAVELQDNTNNARR